MLRASPRQQTVRPPQQPPLPRDSNPDEAIPNRGYATEGRQPAALCQAQCHGEQTCAEPDCRQGSGDYAKGLA